MKKSTFLVLVLSMALCAQQVHSMTSIPKPDILSRLLANSQEETIIGQLHHDIDHMTSGSIIARSFILSKHDTIAKLIQASKRGISVSIILDGARSENKAIESKLKEAGINVILFNARKRKLIHLHSKTILLRGEIDGVQTSKLYFGSTNLSNMAYFNKEIAFISQSSQSDDAEHDELMIDVEQTQQRILEYLQTEKLDPQSPLRVTPLKKRYMSDLDRPVVDSQIWRIRNAKPNAHIDIITMNLNDPAFIEEIKTALARAITFRIFINKSGVNRRTLAMLNELNDYYNIQIFVYSSDLKVNGKFTPIQHAKLILRSQVDENDQSQTLVGIGSANFTKEARSDLNELILIPNDEALFAQAKAFANELAEESTLLQNYLAEHEPLTPTPPASEQGLFS